MITLRIEHKVSSYDAWKKAFDTDPINRKQSGVRRYRIFRPSDGTNSVFIDLEFDHMDQAQVAKTALESIFPKVVGKIIFGVELTLLDVTEVVEL